MCEYVLYNTEEVCTLYIFIHIFHTHDNLQELVYTSIQYVCICMFVCRGVYGICMLSAGRRRHICHAYDDDAQQVACVSSQNHMLIQDS